MRRFINASTCLGFALGFLVAICVSQLPAFERQGPKPATMITTSVVAESVLEREVPPVSLSDLERDREMENKLKELRRYSMLEAKRIAYVKEMHLTAPNLSHAERKLLVKEFEREYYDAPPTASASRP